MAAIESAVEASIDREETGRDQPYSLDLGKKPHLAWGGGASSPGRRREEGERTRTDGTGGEEREGAPSTGGGGGFGVGSGDLAAAGAEMEGETKDRGSARERWRGRRARGEEVAAAGERRGAREARGGWGRTNGGFVFFSSRGLVGEVGRER